VDVILTIAGVALIAAAFRDIFETLFHPQGRGIIGNIVARGIWMAAHRLYRRSGAPLWAGPLGYVAVLASWTAMLTLGWALVFLPHLPEGFNFSGGLIPAEHDSLTDAVYISLVNITSLGYGDISPATDWLRILSPVETLFGLGLLTASISWLVSIYSALRRRESLSHEIQLLREAERRLGKPLAAAEPALLERMLGSFGRQTVAVRRDLIHLPITHYFQSAEDRDAREDLRAFLRELIDQANDTGAPTGLRLEAEMLSMALDDFEATLDGHWSWSSQPVAASGQGT
jgi:Ion channel